GATASTTSPPIQAPRSTMRYRLSASRRPVFDPDRDFEPSSVRTSMARLSMIPDRVFEPAHSCGGLRIDDHRAHRRHSCGCTNQMEFHLKLPLWKTQLGRRTHSMIFSILYEE